MIFCELGALQNFRIIGQANLELSQQKKCDEYTVFHVFEFIKLEVFFL